MIPIVSIMDPRIKEYIAADSKLESIYFFSQELLTEEQFALQDFSLSFKKNWFTYEEYKRYWEDVHFKLTFYKICHVLAIEIIFNDLIH